VTAARASWVLTLEFTHTCFLRMRYLYILTIKKIPQNQTSAKKEKETPKTRICLNRTEVLRKQ
jgi:hypothetical protein